MIGDVVVQWTDHEEIVIETETGTVALIEIGIEAEAEKAGIGKIETLGTGMSDMKKDLTVMCVYDWFLGPKFIPKINFFLFKDKFSCNLFKFSFLFLLFYLILSGNN